MKQFGLFDFQQRSMGGKPIRTIAMARAKTKIGMMNLVYSMIRLCHLKVARRHPG